MDKTLQNSSVKQLIDGMTHIVSNTNDPALQVVEAEKLLRHFLSLETFGLEILQSESSNTKYSRYSLYHDPQDRFEILALVWEPGQQTPLHDHDGTWGVEGVVSGCMMINNYVQLTSYQDETMKLYHAGTLTINKKGTGELLPPADCHILRVQGNEKAVTIHIYGKQLKEFRVFKPLQESGLYSFSLQDVSYTPSNI